MKALLLVILVSASVGCITRRSVVQYEPFTDYVGSNVVFRADKSLVKLSRGQSRFSRYQVAATNYVPYGGSQIIKTLPAGTSAEVIDVMIYEALGDQSFYAIALLRDPSSTNLFKVAEYIGGSWWKQPTITLYPLFEYPWPPGTFEKHDKDPDFMKRYDRNYFPGL